MQNIARGSAGGSLISYYLKIIHVDPVSKEADYSKLPKADLIFVTHDHPDHLDAAALQSIRTNSTIFVLTKKCAQKVSGGTIMCVSVLPRASKI